MLNHDLFIEEFENHDFIFCDTNWWPLIKVQVAYQLQLKNAGTYKAFDNRLGLIKKSTKQIIKDELCFYLQLIKKTKENKNLIVTDNHKTSVDNSVEIPNVNPYTAPFVYYFEKLKIEYATFNATTDNELFGFDLEFLKGYFFRKINFEFHKNLNIQNQLYELDIFLIRSYGKDFKLYDYLVNNIINNQVNYEIFKLIFKKAKIKNILLYCYYNNTMMSIIRAANKLNIVTIEYQHSQVTSNHFGYSNWNAIQKNSGDFFPSKIWVWRQSDAEYLTMQFQKLKKTNFIVGGNLSLSLSKIERKENIDSHIRVLVTLQGIGMPDYITSCLEKQPNLILYLRVHPRYPQDKKFCDILKLKYKEQIELDLANTLPLSDLFNFVDYHLTNFSGSAIEAEYFDVTNIIYGDKGYISYKNEIESQKYLFIENQENLDTIFEQKLKHKPNSKHNKIDIFKLIKENFR